MKKTSPLVCALAVAGALATFVGTPGQALAHAGGHGDEERPVASEAAIRTRLTSEIDRLVDGKKLPASWKGVTMKRLERVSRSRGDSQWMATFENPKEKVDRELFLFANLFGDMADGGFAMDEKAAGARATAEVERLVTVKRLPPSWQEPARKPTKLEKRAVGASWEWVATIDNAADVAQPRLFVVLKPWGDFVDANATGK